MVAEGQETARRQGGELIACGKTRGGMSKKGREEGILCTRPWVGGQRRGRKIIGGGREDTKPCWC